MSALRTISKPPSLTRGSVIFVHGLGGDPIATWLQGNNRSSFWPAWLGVALQDFAVYTLEYDAAPSTWLGSAMALPDRATNILDVLHAGECDRYPIIFVCHSLGGLVVKQLLRIASDQLGTQFGNILTRTR